MLGINFTNITSVDWNWPGILFVIRFSALGQVQLFGDASLHGVGLPPPSYCICDYPGIHCIR